MRIGVPKERRAGERRVAASPETVRKLVQLGAEVAIERDAGLEAGLTDDAFATAGATLVGAEDALGADVVLKVRAPLDDPDELAHMRKGALLIGLLAPAAERARIAAYAAAGVDAMALELVPRISRAQSMDALSSQSNLAGYRAVIDAAHAYGRAMPMMMTAAGTIAPARVLVLGAGVAGLQAVATARRLGAVVSAFDVRPAVKEQVESLGATFIEVAAEADAETAGGYAREMSADYLRRQSERIHEVLKTQTIAITTALIPGRAAPTLITEAMVRDMPEGAVIIDLAAEAGGNCALTRADETVQAHGVTILGPTNMPSRIAADASHLYARNLVAFLTPLINAERKALDIDWSEEIVAAVTLTRAGTIVHPDYRAPTQEQAS